MWTNGLLEELIDMETSSQKPREKGRVIKFGHYTNGLKLYIKVWHPRGHFYPSPSKINGTPKLFVTKYALSVSIWSS